MAKSAGAQTKYIVIIMRTVPIHMFGTTDEVMEMRVKIMAWCRTGNFVKESGTGVARQIGSWGMETNAISGQ